MTRKIEKKWEGILDQHIKTHNENFFTHNENFPAHSTLLHTNGPFFQLFFLKTFLHTKNFNRFLCAIKFFLCEKKTK